MIAIPREGLKLPHMNKRHTGLFKFE